MNEIIKIGDWYYSGKFIDEFEINTPINFPPDTLNKYYGLSKYALESIIHSYIYVNHPMEFNDPYDSIRQFTYDDKDSEGFYKFNLMFVNMGLISMSESSTSMLMWAHYSNHDGFLVNFKLNQLKGKFQFILPMNYIENLPDMQSVDNEPLKFMISTNLKSSCWNYEKEWRLYYDATPMLLPELGKSYKEMNREWIYNQARDPKERKVYYKSNDINYISLGYKFIIAEDHEKIDDETLLLNLDNGFKKQLLDFLIDNEIPTKIISYGRVSEFGLEAYPVKISRIEKNFEYQVKYIT